MMGTGGEEQPRVIVLDKDSMVVKATGPDGEFVTTTQTVKLPELKAHVDQLSDPENEVNSIAFLKGQLDRNPKSFVGMGVWQHFPEGPVCCVAGVYQGQVQSHKAFGEGSERNNVFHVLFLATKSNQCHPYEYHQICHHDIMIS